MIAADLLTMSAAQLRGLLAEGHPIDPRALDDTEYRGVSLGLPHLVEQLTWKKFKKTFHRDRARDVLRGWNVRCEQNGLDEPWLDRQRDGTPVTFGPFEVVAATGARLPAHARRGLLIDYGRGGNLPPLSRLRDPIVALRAGDATLLLGWSYLDLGFSNLGTPSFFSLEYEGPLGYVRP